MNLQDHTPPTTEAQQTNSIGLHPPPFPAAVQDSKIPPLPSPDSAVVHSPEMPPLKSCKMPPLPSKADKPNVESKLKRDVNEFTTVSHTEEGGNQESLPGGPDAEVKSLDWPPPYEPSALDVLTLQAEEIMDLPDLPPPPFFYSEQKDQSPLDQESPCPGTVPETECSVPSPHTTSPLVPQMKPSPNPSLRPPTCLDLTQKKLPSSKRSPPSAFTPHSCSPRLPPQKPTKFPASLYVPVAVGDRRPSNTSQYDNLSEADEDDRCLERLLVSTPEEIPSMHSVPQHTFSGAYDPILYPVPSPPLFIPPSHSPVPSLQCTLTSLPQEPEYEEDSNWVKDSVIPPPPPRFSDRLSPFQCNVTSCSDTHRAASPGFSKPFARGPRDHSAFPAPLLYTGSPPGHSRPSRQPTVGVPFDQSSPNFCRMPLGGHQLPKSVTF